MKHLLTAILISTCFLSACGDGSDTEQPTDSTENRLEQLGGAYEKMSEKGQACMGGDGAACKWLGDFNLEVNGPAMKTNDEIKQVMVRRITAHYKQGCELAHEPACEALAEFQKEHQ